MVPNLVVGRHGYGEVQFKQPVDLSGLSSLDELMGKVVVFWRAVCDVYPDSYQKPPIGEGLNVPAIVHLFKCWPGENALDEQVEDYIEGLRILADKEFISYDRTTGAWSFWVKHF